MAKRIVSEPGGQLSGLDPRPWAIVFAACLHDLREGPPDLRRAAARSLQYFGPEAVPPLCAALEDEDPDVRALAAESLGALGDERAIEPLTAALECCFVARSPRRQLLMGHALRWAGFSMPAVIVARHWVGDAVLLAGTFVIAYFAIASFAIVYQAGHRAQRRQVSAIAGALGRIAEQNAAPELRKALPVLKTVAADAYHQDEQAMRTAREAAARIEAQTAHIRRLRCPRLPAPLPARHCPGRRNRLRAMPGNSHEPAVRRSADHDPDRKRARWERGHPDTA